MLNSYFKSWIPVIKNRFLSEIDFLANTLTNRVLSSFDSIYQEADQVQKEKYENALNSGYPDEDFDYADFVDTGLDEAVDYIYLAEGIKQGVINSFAVNLYHLFEQQFFEMYRTSKWVICQERVKQPTLKKGNEFFYLENSISVEAFISWNRIDELRLLANTIKHADGSSCNKLKTKRPDLFKRSRERQIGVQIDPDPHMPIFSPLAGQGIYVNESDFQEYIKGVKNFWSELSQKL